MQYANNGPIRNQPVSNGPQRVGNNNNNYNQQGPGQNDWAEAPSNIGQRNGMGMQKFSSPPSDYNSNFTFDGQSQENINNNERGI